MGFPFSKVRPSFLAMLNWLTTARASKNIPYVLAQSAVPVSIIQCNTGITWTLAANPANGKTRITSSGAHGLTTSPAVGKSIYITSWSGTGVVGFYNIATVVDTLNLDIDLTYAAGLGNPTVVQANTKITLATVPVPGGAMGPNGALRISTKFGHTNSANIKGLFVDLGGSTFWTQTSTASNQYNTFTTIENRGDASAQIGGGSYLSGLGGTSVAHETGAINTNVSSNLTIAVQPSVANEWVRLEVRRIEVLPGA